MDFANENYVRLYTRETVTYRRMRWEGKLMLAPVLRILDPAGRFDLGGYDPAEAVWLCMPDCPRAVVAAGVQELLDKGVIVIDNDTIVWPNYVAAQYGALSDAQRTREWRARVEAGVTLRLDKERKHHGKVNGTRVMVDESEAFKTFYAAYPRRVGRPEAWRAWKQMDGDSRLDPIMAGLERWRLSAQWMKDGGQFIPHPSTWLRQKRWEDEPEPFLSQQGRFVGG